MQELVVGIMNRFGYAGIGFLITVENIFPPIPSEVILTFGGFLTTYTELEVIGVVFASTVGAVLGAVLLYGVGLLLTPQKLEALFASRICKRLGFSREDMDATVEWFDAHGRQAVFFGRCVPIIRSLISIPAGMAQMSLPLFLLYTVAGSVVWNTALVSLGALAGTSWGIISEYISAYSSLVSLILAVACTGGGMWVFKKKILKK